MSDESYQTRPTPADVDAFPPNEYGYTGIFKRPDIDQMVTDVGASAMTDKAIEDCRWDSATKVLAVKFVNTLSTADKDLLDAIVANNI